MVHHVAVLKLVPNGVHVVWAGLLEHSLEVVGRRPGLTHVAIHGSRHMPRAGATHLPVVVIVVVGRGRSQLRTLLAPLLAALGALPGSLHGDVEWRLPATAWGHLPASWREVKFGHLTIGGVLGGDAV
jgi:hypothetical protein